MLLPEAGHIELKQEKVKLTWITAASKSLHTSTLWHVCIFSSPILEI